MILVIQGLPGSLININFMEPNNRSRKIKLTGKPAQERLKNIKSLLDVKMNVKEINNDIVLNIRFNGLQFLEIFKYLLKKYYIDNFDFTSKGNTDRIKSLSSEIEGKFPAFQINSNRPLTCREIEIMEKLSQGLLLKEIASELGLCTNTVKNHLKNIYPKLGAKNRSEAIIVFLNFQKRSPLIFLKYGSIPLFGFGIVSQLPFLSRLRSLRSRTPKIPDEL